MPWQLLASAAAVAVAIAVTAVARAVERAVIRAEIRAVARAATRAVAITEVSNKMLCGSPWRAVGLANCCGGAAVCRTVGLAVGPTTGLAMAVVPWIAMASVMRLLGMSWHAMTTHGNRHGKRRHAMALPCLATGTASAQPSIKSNARQCTPQYQIFHPVHSPFSHWPSYYCSGRAIPSASTLVGGVAAVVTILSPLLPS